MLLCMLCNFTRAHFTFMCFNYLNLQNPNIILHFSSVVGVFYVDSAQCLLQVHHFVTAHYT